MAFEPIPNNKIDLEDFFLMLSQKSETLKIIKVDDLKQSQKESNQYYFYIHFRILETDCIVKIGFNVKMNPDKTLYIGEGNKLYPLISFVSRIGNQPIKCDKSDIDELVGLEFQAKSEKRRLGNKSYYVLIPIR